MGYELTCSITSSTTALIRRGSFGIRLNPMAVTGMGFLNGYVAHPASKSPIDRNG